MNKVALYIGVDPFTFNDLDLVKKSIKTFGFINIFLDRKNRDAEYKEYFLNYSDRSDIIKHDLKENRIDSYRIIPIDETVEKAMAENSIDTLILNFDYQQNINFRMFKIFQQVSPHLNIILMKGESFIETKFIKTLLDADSSMKIYKKFCSDYAYMKLKVKTMKKIGLTGNFGSHLDECSKIIEEHGYFIIDIDEYLRALEMNEEFVNEIDRKLKAKGINLQQINKENVIDISLKNRHANQVFQKFISDKTNSLIASKMNEIFNNKICVKFSLMCELGMEGMYDKTICLESPSELCAKRLVKNGYSLDYILNLKNIQLDINEKKELCDYVIEDNDDSDIVSQTVKLMNSKLLNRKN